MIDWFVLLVPLAALPIILIFGFLGCVLPRHGGVPPHPSLFIASPGLNLSVIEISVTVTVADVDGPKPPQTVDLKAPSDVPATATTITFDQIDLTSLSTTPSKWGEGAIGPFLTANCVCNLTILGNPPVQLQLPRPTDPPAERSANDTDQFLVDFTLTGSGLDPNNYKLT
jgi:hypothetical protein